MLWKALTSKALQIDNTCSELHIKSVTLGVGKKRVTYLGLDRKGALSSLLVI